MKKALVLLFLLWLGVEAWSQNVQVSRENKTIAVTASEEVAVDAKIAVLEIGFHNYAPTKDAAFQENVRVSNQIVKALLALGIPKDNIQTDQLRLTYAENDYQAARVAHSKREFYAQQAWKVRVAAPDAQKAVDTAVKAGANDVSEPEWAVSDPRALEAKAGAAALAKAKHTAQYIAEGLGVKLGELIYASNMEALDGFASNRGAFAMAAKIARPEPELVLFPQKVKAQVTLNAVFAMQ